jgi:hypothetical protein
VLTAGLVAGVRSASFPFDGSVPPGTSGLARSDSALEAMGILWGALLSRPALAVEALVLAAVAVVLPYVRGRGPWAVAGLGAAFLAAALLPVPEVGAIPLVLAVWATCAAVAVR